jgi:hypothetical protein
VLRGLCVECARSEPQRLLPFCVALRERWPSLLLEALLAGHRPPLRAARSRLAALHRGSTDVALLPPIRPPNCPLTCAWAGSSAPGEIGGARSPQHPELGPRGFERQHRRPPASARKRHIGPPRPRSESKGVAASSRCVERQGSLAAASPELDVRRSTPDTCAMSCETLPSLVRLLSGKTAGR